MAGDWFQFDHELPDKEETLSIVCESSVGLGDTLLALIRLWTWADRQTLDGRLRGVGMAGLIVRCGQSEKFWRAVEHVGWLAWDGNDLIVPNFAKRFGASARRRLLGCRRQQVFKVNHYNGEEVSNAGTVTPSVTPALVGALQERYQESESESQSESKTESVPESQEAGSASAEPCRPAADRCGDVLAVFDHYRTYHPRSFPKPKRTGKEWGLIRKRFADGYTVSDLVEAIDGNHRSPYHCGENPSGTRYHALELIVRDAKHVEMFREVPERPPVLSEKEMRGQRAGQQWLDRMEEHDARETTA